MNSLTEIVGGSFDFKIESFRFQVSGFKLEVQLETLNLKLLCLWLNQSKVSVFAFV